MSGKKASKEKVVKQKFSAQLMWKQRYLLLMSLPFVIWLIVFKYIPLWGWTMAFQDVKPKTMTLPVWQRPFVGFDNFIKAFQDRMFTQTLINTIGLSILGILQIYCPWDVINYCHALKMNPAVKPQNYWVNTSSNDIIRQFVDMAKPSTRNEIELLIEGGSIKKHIRQDLTYKDLYSSIDNLWSLLFTAGYLTQCRQNENSMAASDEYKDGEGDSDMTELVIPNREIRWIFIDQIREWFKEEIAKNSSQLENFCKAFEENDPAAIEEGFNAYLRKTISIRDTSVRKNMKENFYHGILLGIFGNMDDWDVQSNAESGDGYSDIAVEIEDREIGIVIELKYAENAAFDDACKAAAQQIQDRNYEEALVGDGMKTIYRYGIACYKKRCRVVSI